MEDVVSYPAELPLPEDTGIRGTVDVGIRRTSVPVALANQVKDYNAPRVEMSLRFAMTNDNVAKWMQWFFDNKWGWFKMNIVAPYNPVDVMSEHIVRASSPFSYNKAGDNWVNITGMFEVLQNDAQDQNAPVPVYDWIEAGIPSGPSSDWILAGTPSTPAISVLVSHLYYSY